MTEAAQRLKADLSGLSSQDRAEQVEYLISALGETVDPDTLGETVDPDWDVAWTAELDRRWQEIVSGKVVGIQAEEVFRR